MRVFHDDRCLKHDPPTYFRRGALIDHPESPERYQTLLRAALAADGEPSPPEDHGLSPILGVHTRDYIDFLQTAWSRREDLGPDTEEILSGHFSKPQMHRRPEGLLAQMGYYTSDTSTPVRAGTWEAIYYGAQVAISAADASLSDGLAYALCRPPGHHAFADAAAGFCYLNNTAIAAARLRAQTGQDVAILDIDVHHGNGAQAIFYEDPSVYTVSIHCDPSDYYPFFAGYPDETGKGDGAGSNLNLALPKGTGDTAFMDALEEALDAIDKRAPGALVIALGLDAAEHDPIGAFNITQEGFAAIAARIGRVSLPTALIQEGGYLCDALGPNLEAFLTSIGEAKAGA